MSLIEVQKVSYTYADGFAALKQVNLSIEKGERIAVLGPNGAGKSTLFQLFNGLLQASSGKVTVDGLLVEKKNLFKIRAGVGMVFQDSDDQLFNSTVRQEVAYGLMNMHISGKVLDDTIDWALDVAGIGGYGEKSPHNLSGGEKKRVALASVLAMKPDVLVLDEPTAALDPHGVSNLVKLLNSINQELGITLIFSSHDADVVPLLADRVYLMSAGNIVLSGTTAEVFSQKEALRKIGLRLPRVAHLTEILQQDGFLKSQSLPLTIGQARSALKKACGKNNQSEAEENHNAHQEVHGVLNGIETVSPDEIEKKSFEIITGILGERDFSPINARIIKRVIHTTADFDYADILKISDGAVEKAMVAIRSGCTVLTDTSMVAAGISKKTLAGWGGNVVCLIGDDSVAKEAKERNVTRSSVCVERYAALSKNGIYMIGNAPTALIRLSELIKEGSVSPALVVGVPVGFVNVVEAKNLIMSTGVPYIVSEGRKGGSNVAAAIINAILYMTRDEAG
jgi:cobalt/nickel transport system ATP-binding protein